VVPALEAVAVVLALEVVVPALEAVAVVLALEVVLVPVALVAAEEVMVLVEAAPELQQQVSLST
jgi:hypothetical protein